MAKKRKHGGVKAPAGKPASRSEGFGSPFKELKTMLAQRSETVSKTPAAANLKVTTANKPVTAEAQQPAQDLPDEPLDDEAILRRALEGVRPFKRRSEDSDADRAAHHSHDSQRRRGSNRATVGPGLGAGAVRYH